MKIKVKSKKAIVARPCPAEEFIPKIPFENGQLLVHIHSGHICIITGGLRDILTPARSCIEVLDLTVPSIGISYYKFHEIDNVFDNFHGKLILQQD